MHLTWTLNSGDGRTVLVSYCPSKLTCHLPQWSSSGCSDATARQAVTQAGVHVENMDSSAHQHVVNVRDNNVPILPTTSMMSRTSMMRRRNNSVSVRKNSVMLD